MHREVQVSVYSQYFRYYEHRKALYWDVGLVRFNSFRDYF